MTNAERVRSMRKASGLSAQKFGDKYGIPLRTLQDWERGERTAPNYVIDLIEYAEKIERLQLTTWVFEEYRDSRGIGSQKFFASEYAAIEYAQDTWAQLSDKDRKSYREDPAAYFCVNLYRAEYDEATGDFYPDGDAITQPWTISLK